MGEATTSRHAMDTCESYVRKGLGNCKKREEFDTEDAALGYRNNGPVAVVTGAEMQTRS